MDLRVFCIIATITGTGFLSAAVATDEECPSLLLTGGTGRAANGGGVFINTQNPVDCNGTAVGWQYCYYGSDDGDSYAVTLLLYNVNFYLGTFYTRVDGSQIVARVARPRNAGCSSYDLTPDEQFEVTAGTVIGACLQRDHAVDRELSVISRDKPGLSLMYQPTGCTESDLNLVALGVNPRPDYAMHVSLIVRTDDDDILLPQQSTTASYPPSTTASYLSSTTVTVASSRIVSSTTVPEVSSTFSPTASSSTLSRMDLTSGTTLPQSVLASTTQPLVLATISTGYNVAIPQSVHLSTTTSTEYEITPSVSPLSDSGPKAFKFGIPAIIAISVSSAVILLAIILICVATAFIVRSRRKKKYVTTHSPRQHIGRDHFVMVTENPNAEGLQAPQEYEEPINTNKRERSKIDSLGSRRVKSLQELASLMARRISEQHYEFDSGFHNEVQKGKTSQRHRVDDSPHYEFDSEYRPEENEASTENWPAASFYDRTYPLQAHGNYADLHYGVLCPNYYKVLEMSSSEDSEETPYFEPASSEKELYMQFLKQNLKHIPQGDIRVTSRLGSGQFGQVSKGIWKQNGSYVHVAVKMLSSAAPTENKVKLLQEAAIMGQFMHPNVTNLLGVVIKSKVMLVMELASKGDLKSHMHSLKTVPGKSPNPDTNKILLSFTQQIAFGMQYLSSKGFVHRDLAARNILLTEGNLCKIADFGMSRNLEDTNYYVSQGGKIPVKWTAPEAIHFKKYSTASDVWSYGCVLYEIWSLGKTPFQWCTNVKVVEELQTGYRLPPPPGCPKIIYLLMMRCWNSKSSERPTFRDIIILLMEPEVKILEIPEEDLFTRDLAGELGGPLEAGEMMYPELQREYRRNSNEQNI